MLIKNALGLSHEYIKKVLRAGDIAVDATCGNGHDTLLLSSLVGKSGHVYGFDIQETALENTRRRLEQTAEFQNVTLIHSGHEQMEQFVPKDVAAVMFNFGYLPGGDHKMATRKETSIRAIAAATRLLRQGGIITLCIYSGGDTGFEEKDEILAFCHSLDPKQFIVLAHEFINQENNPPMLVCLEKRL